MSMSTEHYLSFCRGTDNNTFRVDFIYGQKHECSVFEWFFIVPTKSGHYKILSYVNGRALTSFNDFEPRFTDEHKDEIARQLWDIEYNNGGYIFVSVQL